MSVVLCRHERIDISPFETNHMVSFQEFFVTQRGQMILSFFIKQGLEKSPKYLVLLQVVILWNLKLHHQNGPLCYVKYYNTAVKSIFLQNQYFCLKFS